MLIIDLISISKLEYLIRYFRYRIKYPSLALSPTIKLSQKIKLATNISIGNHSHLDGQISIGENTTLNEFNRIYGNVIIGSNCLFSNNVFISSGTHIFDKLPELPIKEQDVLYKFDKPILIEDDCWIGINTVIMPGVKIAKGSIVGANSVVTKSVPPYTIVAGCPAKEIKKRLEFVPPEQLIYSDPTHLPYFYKGFFIREYEKNKFNVRDGFLTSNTFVVCLDTLHKKQISLEVKKYKKNCTISFQNATHEINLACFETITFDIKEKTSFFLEFFVSEKIIIRKAF